MSRLTPETEIEFVAELDDVLIAAGVSTQVTGSVDLLQHDSVLFAIEVTDINTSGTLQVTIEDSPDDSVWATALQPDGSNAAMAAASIAADGIYYVRALAENVDRYIRLSIAVAGAGVDYHVNAVKFGKKTKAAANTAGSVGHLQLGLPA